MCIHMYVLCITKVRDKHSYLRCRTQSIVDNLVVDDKIEGVQDHTICLFVIILISTLLTSKIKIKTLERTFENRTF